MKRENVFVKHNNINKFSENIVNMKGLSGSLKQTERLLLHAVNY
jgi:hypothetical protein